jgi:hypothetical protein
MMDTLQALMAHKHWPYIWPCYALALAAFGALAFRAAHNLRKWRAASEKAQS